MCDHTYTQNSTFASALPRHSSYICSDGRSKGVQQCKVRKDLKQASKTESEAAWPSSSATCKQGKCKMWKPLATTSKPQRAKMEAVQSTPVTLEGSEQLACTDKMHELGTQSWSPAFSFGYG